MIIPTLKRAIQALEEKGFYDIALLFLSAHGYKDLSVVDGTGMGDVTSPFAQGLAHPTERPQGLAEKGKR